MTTALRSRAVLRALSTTSLESLSAVASNLPSVSAPTASSLDHSPFSSRADLSPSFAARSYYSGPEDGMKMRGTTILCVRRDDKVVVIGDGQVSMGNAVVKSNMVKVRKIYDGVVAGFAGSTADAMALFDLLEAKLEATNGQLLRAAVDFAKDWRLQKAFGRLDATLIVADKKTQLQITGNGEVLESTDGILCIGSGSPYAMAAAKALIDVPGMDALAIARKAMRIAADTCVFTNDTWTVEELAVHVEEEGPGGGEGAGGKAEPEAASKPGKDGELPMA